MKEENEYKDLIIGGSLPPVDEVYLQNFEIKLGQSLPAGFRRFLLRHNGGGPSKYLFNYYSTENEEEAEGDILRFLGLHDDDPNSIQTKIQGIGGRISSIFVPVGTTNSGDLLCLGVQDEVTGKIFLWKHEFKTLEFIANDFDEFISKLYLP